MPRWITDYWKAVTAGAGLLATVLTAVQPALGGEVPSWVPVVIAVATTVAVWRVPNTNQPS